MHSLPKRLKLTVVRNKLNKAKQSLTSELAAAAGIDKESLIDKTETSCQQQLKKFQTDSIAL